MWTLEQLKYCKESEDKVEFKKGEHGNIAYDGGSRIKPSERRRCILGYVTALCNEKGGSIIIGMEDKYPHRIIGTSQCEGAIGQLEADIYRDTGIRVIVYELYENEINKKGRVLIIEVPSRPFGRVFKFEDVALMRVGEELKPMSDEVFLKIIQEQEPDFSEQLCENASINDLNDDAINILRQKYALKQKNPSFLTLPKKQILSDLGLIEGKKVTNAAILLLGKDSILQKLFPQAAIMLEYRSTESQIPFDNRKVYRQAFYLMIDKLWKDIDARNGAVQVKDGPYIFDIPYFNEEVIRESINNAIAHRDYRRNSETVIKQYPQKLIITNIGGFPIGVTIDNLLTIPSTPRNRLLADVLSKTGIVERSGQGVDKIFKNTLSEGKEAPDYSHSDMFKVELRLSATNKDKAFALFLESVQQSLTEEQKLSVFEIIALDKIRQGNDYKELDRKIIEKLEKRGLIEKRGKTKGAYYILSQSYYEFTDNKVEYFKRTSWDLSQAFSLIVSYLNKNSKAKMGEFVNLFDGHLSRKQVRTFIQQLVDNQILISEGKGYGTSYSLGNDYKKKDELMNKAFILGCEELKRRGEM